MAQGLLPAAVVRNTRHFSAVLCQRRAVWCITIAIAGCGGAVEQQAVDGGASADASSSPPPNGCPSESDVATGAAVGKTCAPDGTYCADPACDPCTKTCAAVRCTQGV